MDLRSQTARERARSEVAVEIAGCDRDVISSEILRILCTQPEADVVITVKRDRYFSIRVEDLSSIPGHGLVYRVLVDPTRIDEVESCANKTDPQVDTRYSKVARIGGAERIVGSDSRHWIGDDEVMLPHLGHIELAKAQISISAGNPFKPLILRDCGDISVGPFQTQHGQCAFSATLGADKRLNEDAVLVRRLPINRDGVRSFLGVVADGMGGYLGAQAAAGSIVATFATADFGDMSLLGVSRRLPSDLKRLRDDLHQRNEPGIEHLISKTMGAPFAAVRIFDSSCEVVRAGDCRVALYRNGQDGYKCEWNSEDQAAGHQVWNAVRLVGGEPGTINLEVVNLGLQHGDYLVVATDGVWGRMSLDRVRELISEARNPERAERAIVTEVALREFQTSRSDNRGLIVYQHGVLAFADHTDVLEAHNFPR